MKNGILILLALVLGTSTLAFSATEEASQKKSPESKATAGQKASQKVKDPVCGNGDRLQVGGGQGYLQGQDLLLLFCQRKGTV